MVEKHDPPQCNHRFVADGYGRARDAIEPEIRAEVEREFAKRLQTASFLKRWRLRREMAAEIKRRIHARAPPDALY